MTLELVPRDHRDAWLHDYLDELSRLCDGKIDVEDEVEIAVDQYDMDTKQCPLEAARLRYRYLHPYLFPHR